MPDEPMVLVAEDDEGYSFAIRRALERAGFTVKVVENEADLRRDGPSARALVVDVRLATRACEGLHATNDLVRDGLRVPIMFVSVYSKEEVEVELQRLEHLTSVEFGWLTKPFEPALLARRVREQIDAVPGRVEAYP